LLADSWTKDIFSLFTLICFEISLTHLEKVAVFDQIHALVLLQLWLFLTDFKTAYGFSKSEVANLESACFTVYENILRFNVSMNQPFAVNLLKGYH
jgi:hypothetical protein